ncbi:MAG: hypothetical protein QOJ74_1817 [Ilumatobacteraceae bacterium]|jgi:hemerythrin-like domain-containing protein|nr:hypothetical protein [Ilumatobacteraceae bacterium]
MNDPATILKADHREAKRLMNALAESDEGSERETMAQELNDALTLHMEIEERILYPVVAREVGADDEEEAEIEHGLARNGLATLMSMVDKPGFGAAVEMLKGGILHHVEEEETEIFPELKSSLERSEWLALGDAIAEAKAAAGKPVPSAPRRRSGKRKSASRR